MMTLFHSAELQRKNPVKAGLSIAKTTIDKTAAQEQELDLAA